jgi:hypothetical protein
LFVANQMTQLHGAVAPAHSAGLHLGRKKMTLAELLKLFSPPVFNCILVIVFSIR